MHQPLIIQHLFQVSSLQDVSRERLEAFVETYPSYGVGHYLLSCKLQAEGSERFLPETQRTCLYFSNPLWLQWQLQNLDGMAAAQPAEAPAAWIAEPAAEEPVVEEHVAEVHAAEVHVAEVPDVSPAPVIEEPSASVIGAPDPETLTTGGIDSITAGEGEDLAAPAAIPEAEGPSAAEQLLRSIEEARGLRESVQIPEPADQEVTPHEGPIHDVVPDEAPIHEVNSDEAPIHEVTPDVTADEAPIHDEEAPFVLDEQEEQQVRTAEPAPAEQPAVAETQPAAEIPAVAETQPIVEIQAVQETPTIAETPAVLETPVVEPQPVAGSQFVAESQPTVEPQSIAQPQPAVEAAATTEARTPPQPPIAEPNPAATPTQDFLFEPYHTIDYFASQGIKLTLDENPQDKLGKQLKSFTEWLKTMRRLPQKDREVVPDRVMEEAIQTSAAHSILGKDIVTETMAEVLAMQGMREKARAVYEKLSLLNPDKRAYFAAKIEQLNIP